MSISYSSFCTGFPYANVVPKGYPILYSKLCSWIVAASSKHSEFSKGIAPSTQANLVKLADGGRNF